MLGIARRASRLVVLLLAGPLLACACSGTGSGTAADATPARTSVSPAPQPSPTNSAARAALAAYTGMWKEMQAAGATANWKDPRLALFASGQALQTLVTGLQDASKEGIVIKGTIVIHPKVDSASLSGSPPQVTITDCVDDTHWLNYVRSTGKLQNNVPGGHHLAQAVVTLSSGRWTVSRLVVQGVGTC